MSVMQPANFFLDSLVSVVLVFRWFAYRVLRGMHGHFHAFSALFLGSAGNDLFLLYTCEVNYKARRWHASFK